MTNKEQILSVAQAYYDMVSETSLVGNQKKLDVNDNDKIDADDLAALRAGAKANEAAQEPETPASEPQPTAEVPTANPPAEAPAEAPVAETEPKDDDEDEEELDESVALKKKQDMLRVTHGAMSMADYRAKWKGFKKKKPESDALSGMISAYKNKPKPANVNEVLDPKADAGEWISDFVNSDDPKFAGKSKEERKQQALAAWYSARREAGISEEVMTEATASELSKQAHALSSKAETPGDHKKAANAHYKAAEALRRHTTANAGKTGAKADAAHTSALEHEKLGDKHYGKSMNESTETLAENASGTDLTAAANQASALAHSTPAEAGALKPHDDATRAHYKAADHYHAAAQNSSDPVERNVAQIHHQFHSDMAKHHMLRGVSLSMDESTVNEAKSCEEEVGATEADWDAHYCKQTPEMQEAINRGKNVGLRYPEAYKVARNVVRNEGTEEPRAQGEKDFKNMHDDNIEISNDPATSGSVTGADKVTQAEKPETPANPPVMDVKSLKSVAEAYIDMLNKGV